MFEISIFCVIVLAVGYWVVLWTMGRRDDVLHGRFVHVEGGPEAAAPKLVAPALVAPVLVAPTLPAPLANSTETLQSLLTSIKRDLKDAAQI